MNHEMSFQVITNIFWDFNMCVTGRPTNQPTDIASYRGAMALLKSNTDPIPVGAILEPTM